MSLRGISARKNVLNSGDHELLEVLLSIASTVYNNYC